MQDGFIEEKIYSSWSTKLEYITFQAFCFGMIKALIKMTVRTGRKKMGPENILKAATKCDLQGIQQMESQAKKSLEG